MNVSLWKQQDALSYECIYCNTKVNFMHYYCPTCEKRMIYEIDVNSCEDIKYVFNQLPENIQNMYTNQFIMDLATHISKILFKNYNKDKKEI